jgi:intracellular multiplication protein IcmJ
LSALLPITLGVGRALLKSSSPGQNTNRAGHKTGSVSSLSASGKIAAELKSKIFERDQYCCRYCGFISRKYQEINFLNNDKSDLSEKNLVTSCIFCHQCFHLETVNAMKSGVLLWLPEMEQADVNHIARAIYVARISQGPVADAARKSLDALMMRREEAKQRISTDNPYILSMVLADYLGPSHYALRDKKLKGIRLFPLGCRQIKEADLEFNQFPQILAYWRSKDGPFGGKPPQQWVSIYKDLAA